jgi:four helix bundle protein
MKLEELKVYQNAMNVAEEIYQIVMKWDDFSRNTIGIQCIRSIDSVAANISEGFGRFHFKESKHFNYYSRGSLYESKTWLKKAHNRNLINEETFDNLEVRINSLGVQLNNYINSIGKSYRTFRS